MKTSATDDERAMEIFSEPGPRGGNWGKRVGLGAERGGVA